MTRFVFKNDWIAEEASYEIVNRIVDVSIDI